MTQRLQTANCSGASRKLFTAVGLAVVVSMLSACGAVIDTFFAINDDSSGARLMSATLPADQESELRGGREAADESIRKNIPPQIEYGGLAEDPNGDIVAVFTISFANPEEYESKIAYLLGESEDDGESYVEFVVTDSPLREGTSLTENFTSYDLLRWLFDGLVDDGIMPDSRRSQSFSLGESVIVYQGEELPSESSLSFSRINDNGFDEVTMLTDISSPDAIRRTIRFQVTQEKAATQAERYEKFFSDATAAGTDVVAGAQGEWAVSFSGDAADISRLTDAVFANAGSFFTLSWKADQTTPTISQVEVAQKVVCDMVCAEGVSVLDVMTGNDAMSPDVIDLVATEDELAYFEVVAPFQSITTVLDVGYFGSFTNQTNFAVQNRYLDYVEQGAFEALLAPEPSRGTIEVKAGAGDMTIFTVAIEGADFDQFGENFAAWSPGSELARRDSESVSGATAYSVDFDFQSVIDRHRVLEPPTLTMNFPPGVSVSLDEQSLVEESGLLGSTFTLPASGRVEFLTTGSFMGVAVFMVLGSGLVVGMGILIVKRREEVAALLDAARARAKEPLSLPGDDGPGASVSYPPRISLLSVSLPPMQLKHPGSLVALPTSTASLQVPRAELHQLPLPPETQWPRGRVSLITGAIESKSTEPVSGLFNLP